MNRVVFAHGRESGPWGRKITALAAVAVRSGWSAESPDFTSQPDPEARVAQLCAAVPFGRGRLVLVGSSMGGYVVTRASARLPVDGLFLLAPAVGLPGYAVAAPEPQARHLAIVHGWRDAVVPPDQVVAFACRYRAPLTLLDDDHALTASLPLLERLFAIFLAQAAEAPNAARLSPHL